MNMNVSGWGSQRPSVAGISIPRNRVSKTSFGTQVKQAAEAKLAAQAAERTTQIEGRKDIWEPYTTYTPGEGYTGYLPGSDQPVLRWGREYNKLMFQRAKEYAANHVEEPFTRRELTTEELAEFAAKLSGKYNPRKMTQEDYDSFLDDLMAEGLCQSIWVPVFPSGDQRGRAGLCNGYEFAEGFVWNGGIR